MRSRYDFAISPRDALLTRPVWLEKRLSSFLPIPPRLILMNQLRSRGDKDHRACPLSAVTRESLSDREREKDPTARGEEKERERESQVVKGERGHSRNKIERNGGGMEWNSIGMARDAGQFALNCRIGRVTRTRSRRVILLAAGGQSSRRVISRIFSISFSGRERRAGKRKLDTYVQVRPSRFLSRRAISAIPHADGARVRRSCKNLPSRHPGIGFLVMAMFYIYICRSVRVVVDEQELSRYSSEIT